MQITGLPRQFNGAARPFLGWYSGADDGAEGRSVRIDLSCHDRRQTT